MAQIGLAEFIEYYPVSSLHPADYNPRFLSEGKFTLLRESISKFGIVKPIIVNGKNGVLTAGHQRVRTMQAIGMRFCPAIRLIDISLADEISFNLFHNKIETSQSTVSLKLASDASPIAKYFYVAPENITFTSNDNATVVTAISLLMRRYGAWGSAICDSAGRIINNSDYAIACAQMHLPLLCYMVPDSAKSELLRYLSYDFGVYFYNSLKIKNYNQANVQIHRLRGTLKNIPIRSLLYENYVIPNITKKERLLDFGAGKCRYAELLSSQGYRALAYEPFNSSDGTINVRKTVKQIDAIQADISAHGLYDTLVLEAVLNSVISIDYEHAVLIACASLLRNNGRILLTARNLACILQGANNAFSADFRRQLYFLDDNNFSVSYQRGVWTMQHFYDATSLLSLLSHYFENCRIIGALKDDYLTAICSRPRKFPRSTVARALEMELNMEYPGNYHHNRHKNLIDTIMTTLDRENRYED